MKKASLLIGLCLVLAAPLSLAQGTAFTYQGRLNNGTNPANGTYDLSFALFSVLSGAGQVGTTQTNSSVAVSNGLFTAALDFGANFPGANRWLEIGVRSNGVASFTTLVPRQKLTATPYAITASNLTGTLPATQLSGTLSSAQLGGTYSTAITLNNAGNSFSGSGAGLTGVNAITLGGLGVGSFWNLLGNGGTTPGVNFLGTTDDQALELKVNNTRAFRLEPNATSPNVIGGYSGNAVSGGIYGAVIAGGGSSGAENIIRGIFGTVGGGLNNTVLDYSDYATIGGGGGNEVGSGGIPFTRYSTVGGGATNRVRSKYSTIGGGLRNFIGAGTADDEGSTIGGGVQNSIALDFGAYGTVGGGYSNYIYHGTAGTIAGGYGNENGASGSVIGGGSRNFIAGYDLPPGLADGAVIAGGSGNTIDNGGQLGTISGGSENSIDTADLGLPPWGAVIGGGTSNLATRSFSTIPGGLQAKTTNHGQMAYASGQFANTGDAQTSTYVARGTTANTNLTELFLDGAGERMRIPVNSTWVFEVFVAARSSTGNSAGYQIRGTIKNNAGTTSFSGLTSFTALGSDVPTWDASVAADNANDALRVQVNGSAGTSVRWVATVRTTEVSF